ncbi:TetR/AcrR family transcriptional regulator [Streptacidiphilus fuscans]|uniref:TetR/AcrR family transcriptional regulator n=1 Tax=Streptacidiphilus fuscans TaxID=2789292 RepID=A0A931B542_9ACTN|nr:TetR/AcrR family transcriptional regulator [Streptacidiphilus fuscans]MBF9071380.1 TetR/AcrR family transcriptional regulator [Streptacidiphilus fuscans]
MRSDTREGAPVKAKRVPRAQREQQMLDAAVRIFSRSGYHAASMDEIAEACDVSKPMLYLYLGSKEELFAACIRREADRIISAFASAADPSLDPGEQLFRGLTAFFGFVAEHRESWIVLYQQARAQGEPVVEDVTAARHEVVTAVTALLRRGIREAAGERTRADGEDTGPDRGEAAAMAQVIVGAADSLAGWVLDTGPEPPEETARRLMSIIWIGLEPRLRGARYEG